MRTFLLGFALGLSVTASVALSQDAFVQDAFMDGYTGDLLICRGGLCFGTDIKSSTDAVKEGWRLPLSGERLKNPC